MSNTAILVMALILGFVWGGFLLIVAKAVRAEREKRVSDATSSIGGERIEP